MDEHDPNAAHTQPLTKYQNPSGGLTLDKENTL
jgi:hypothetical protein